MTTAYAVPDSTRSTILNVVLSEPVSAEPTWVLCSHAGPGIGWMSSDSGKTWTPPPMSVTVVNAATIETNLTGQLALIEAWIAANPTGAVLTAAQTLILARMIAGLTRTALQLTATVGGS